MPIKKYSEAYWLNIDRGLMGDGQLNPLDWRNPYHPRHDAQWFRLAGILGRAAADADWDRLHKSEEGAGK